METRRFLLVAVAATAMAGWLGGAQAALHTAQANVPGREPLLAVFHPRVNSGAVLARVDPASLRPVSRVVRVGEYHQAWSVSPDGSQAALARGGHGIGIQIVDLDSMKPGRQLRTGIAAEALGWLAPRLLVAALQRGGTVIVDPETGKITRRWPGFSFPDAAVQTRDGLVMVFPRLERTRPNFPLTPVSGTARLAVVDARGRLRSVVLERIRLRAFSPASADRAGLAVDEARHRAYVFAAGVPVAEVDLRNLRVAYHRVAALVGEPSSSGTGPRLRGAVSLGGRIVVAFGRDLAVAGKEAPAGAWLVDTRSWRSRALDRDAAFATFDAGRIVVYESSWHEGAGRGVRGYTPAGRKVFERLKQVRVYDVEAAAGRAYVRGGKATFVVDLVTGKVAGTITPPVDLVDVIPERR